MHSDLKDVVRTAKEARDGVLNKEMTVKEANSIAANNQTVLMAHVIDLRERMFLSNSLNEPSPSPRGAMALAFQP